MKHVIEANIRIAEGLRLYVKKGSLRIWTTEIKKAKQFCSYKSAYNYLIHNMTSYGLTEYDYKICIKE